MLYYPATSVRLGAVSTTNNIKDVNGVNIVIGHLERMLLTGEITEEEYKEKKKAYVDILLELYVKDIISKEELYEKLNQ